MGSKGKVVFKKNLSSICVYSVIYLQDWKRALALICHKRRHQTFSPPIPFLCLWLQSVPIWYQLYFFFLPLVYINTLTIYSNNQRLQIELSCISCKLIYYYFSFSEWKKWRRCTYSSCQTTQRQPFIMVLQVLVAFCVDCFVRVPGSYGLFFCWKFN